MHQIVPHRHHQHEATHTHKAVTQNNTHSHDHHHNHESPEKENTKNNLLDLFLNVHVHSIVSNEVILAEANVVKPKLVKNPHLHPVFVNHTIYYNDYHDIDEFTVYHPPENYFNPYLTSPDLRAPPYIG